MSLDELASIALSDAIGASRLVPFGFYEHGRYQPFVCYEKCTAYRKLTGLVKHYIEQHSGTFDLALEKPYRCPVGDCAVSYKNANGLSYHLEKNHFDITSDYVTTKKPKNTADNGTYYKCPHEGCNKRYKNYQGLGYHLTLSKFGHSRVESVLHKSSAL